MEILLNRFLPRTRVQEYIRAVRSMRETRSEIMRTALEQGRVRPQEEQVLERQLRSFRFGPGLTPERTREILEDLERSRRLVEDR